MKKNYISVELVALLLFSCTSEIEVTDQAGLRMTIKASIEGKEKTKTMVDNGLGCDGTKVYWEDHEEIAVFYNGLSGLFVSQNTDLAVTTDFSGTLNYNAGQQNQSVLHNQYWGLYPYREDAYLDVAKGVIITTLSPEQIGRPGSFERNTQMALANSLNQNLSFYNVTGGLRFSLTHARIRKITFEGNNGEPLAGTVEIGFENSVPVINKVLKGESKITLTPSWDKYFEVGQWFYFAALPANLSHGFKMVFYGDNDSAEISTDKPVLFKRGVYGSLVDVDYGIDLKEDSELEKERNALIAIYNALDGDNWYNNENWCSDRPVGEWYGITTSSRGYVSRIDLSCNHLSGTLDLGLMRFSHCRSISLCQNGDSTTGAPCLTLSFPQDAPEFVSMIDEIDFSHCLIKTELPEWFFVMPRLENLQINLSTIPAGIGSLTSLRLLNILTSRLSVIPNEIGNLSHLKKLYIQCNGFIEQFVDASVQQSGRTIPDSFGNLNSLETLEIVGMHLEEGLPNTIGNLSNLRHFEMWDNDIPVPLPDEIGNLKSLRVFRAFDNTIAGELPRTISNLELNVFYIPHNNLSGQLPEDMGRMLDTIDSHNDVYGLSSFDISCNRFSGPVPESITNHLKWKIFWNTFVKGNYFNNMREVIIPGPEIKGKDIYGNTVDSETIYKQSDFTFLLQYPINHPREYPLQLLYPSLDAVKSIYNQYKTSTTSFIVWDCGENISLEEYYAFMDDYGDSDWICIQPYSGVTDPASGYSTHTGMINGYHFYPTTGYDAYNNIYLGNYLCVVDNTGNIIYDTYRDMFYTDYSDLIACLSNCLEGADNSEYYSSDYSKDGEVHLVQQASKGKGIELIIMGDGYSDRQIDNGLFDIEVDRVTDALFSEEPFKSMREYFTVYSINVISKREGVSYGAGNKIETALQTYIGEGTYVSGKESNVLQYALKAVPSDRMDDALIIVLMNKDAYAGTCFMYYPPSGDYGRGLSIAYFPTSSDTDTFNGIVSHEAGGHGFAKLADEYSYEDMGAIWDEMIISIKKDELLGWFKNVDFTPDPAQVKWAQFISDERYANESLGCYEGGLTFWKGVWRPTENSIMNTNTGGFNAPSRYAIWYRIGKQAYGENWEGSYEDFVAYDQINRTPAAVARRKAQRLAKPLPPHAPPVVVGHSWREELQK